jgi:hypothetical protein
VSDPRATSDKSSTRTRTRQGGIRNLSLATVARTIVLLGCLISATYAQADPRVVLCIFQWQQAPDFDGGVAVFMIVDGKTVIVSDHDLDRPVPEQKVVRSFHFDRPADDWKCGDTHKVEKRDLTVRRCARLVSRTGNSIIMDFKSRVTDSLGYGREAEIQFRVELGATCDVQLLKADAIRVPTSFRESPDAGARPIKVKQQTCNFITK